MALISIEGSASAQESYCALVRGDGAQTTETKGRCSGSVAVEKIEHAPSNSKDAADSEEEFLMTGRTIGCSNQHRSDQGVHDECSADIGRQRRSVGQAVNLRDLICADGVNSVAK